MTALKPTAIELSESDVLPIEDEWGPADSIPLLELSAIMEVEHEPQPEPHPVLQAQPRPTQPLDPTHSAVATRVAEPVPCLEPRATNPSPAAAAVAALSTSAPTPSDSLVTWQPRRRSFGWIMGTAAAASVAVILLGWSLAPTSASAEPAAVPQPAAAVVLRAEVDEPEPVAVVAPVEEAPDNRASARKWATIGNRQLKDGNNATAQKMFERALAAQPKNRMAHAGLGKIALRRNQPRRALNHLRSAVEIEPRKADNRRLLAQAYMALGRRAKARTHLQKAVQYGDVPAQQLLMEL
ncbi:MAG: tetratricopeptide repeat protein [Nannocystales bacterium]